jgi:hypothetical protein
MRERLYPGRVLRLRLSCFFASLALAIFAAGLLAKSYFLVFVPFAALLALWVERRRIWVFAGLVAAIAGPWCARNVLLCGSLTGFQASVRTIPQADMMRVFWSMKWPSALMGLAHSALWNANSSFTVFS